MDAPHEVRINIPIPRKLREKLKFKAIEEGKTIRQVVNESLIASTAPSAAPVRKVKK